MSRFFKEKKAITDSKNRLTTSTSTSTASSMPVCDIQDLTSPFSEPPLSLSDSDLRLTAYEILVAACRTSGGKPLTYIPQSEKTDRGPTTSSSSASAPSLQRSLTANAASKVKKALGMKSMRKRRDDSSNAKRAVTIGELVRVQMRVSEQTDSRIRRALLRVAAGQVTLNSLTCF